MSPKLLTSRVSRSVTKSSTSSLRQLSGILEHANDIAALDLTGVVATAHPFDLINVVRDDELRVSLSRDEVLAMAPDAEGGRFAVPRIMGRSAMRRAIDIAADVRAGTTSALGETQVALEAIRARNDELNVFLHIDETGATRGGGVG